MYSYYAYGLRINSELKIPKFVACNSKCADVLIRLDDLDIPSEKIILEGNHYKVTPMGTYFFWNGTGIIKVQNGNEIIVDPDEDIDFLRYLVMGVAFAVLLHQRGLLVLHGSAVRSNKNAIIFLGNSGLGKSSLALALNNRGFPIVTDDILPVSFINNFPIVSPGFPHLKISEDILKVLGYEPSELPQIHLKSSKRSKSVIKNFSTDPLNLKAVYIISDGEKSDIKSLSPQKALINLVNNSYNFHRFLEEDRIKNLKQCAKVVKNVPVNLLTIRRSLNEIHDLITLVENDFSLIDNDNDNF